ncbi:MAG: sulfur carrier protein ThiS adenylyltransferase ThiF [Bacteroidales bacterium]|nr:sulfur carrier protein ThiS adenylyltransferase ThiF [Bacteroidales bacterium]
MLFEDIRKKLAGFKVGIAGAGGLGSNCAAALVRVGISDLVVADFDVVTSGNLNRQFYFSEQTGMKKVLALKENLLRINPELKMNAMDLTITEENLLGVFSGCDLIVEAFDLAEMKLMLIEGILEKMPDIPLITGNGLAGWGDNSSIHCRKEGNLYICGDEKSEISALMPPLAPRVGMVACMQANVALEILLAK